MTGRIDLAQLLEAHAADIAAEAPRHDAEDSFVAGTYDLLRRERVFSALVPQALGGGGATHREMCDFLRGLARACPSTALALSMHQHLVAAAAANDKAGRPGRALLQKVADGERVLVSTGANDWLSSNGQAERCDGGFRVWATKPFASGSPAGDILVTSVAHDGGQSGPEVLHFPLPLDARGVTFLEDWQAMGMRGTGSQSLRLEGCFVPEDAVVLRRPRGPFHPAFAVILTVALPLIMSAYLGVAEEAAETARTVARPRADDPAAQHLAGELENRLTAARLAVEDMARMADGYAFTPSAGLAAAVLARKTLAATAVIGAAETALELAGGAGYLRRTGLERLLRDAHGAMFHPLPAARQRMFCGRVALGLDPVPLQEAAVSGRAA